MDTQAEAGYAASWTTEGISGETHRDRGGMAGLHRPEADDGIHPGESEQQEVASVLVCLRANCLAPS